MNEAAAKRESLLEAAELLLPRYLEATGGLSHEPKGIRRSEMFFFYASVALSILRASWNRAARVLRAPWFSRDSSQEL